MTTVTDVDVLKTTAKAVRKSILKMVYLSGASHVGPSLSCTDILTSIYAVAHITPKNANDPTRDRVILSKGHAAAALFAILAEKGFFDKELLDTYDQDASVLGGHPDAGCVPGIETTTGSLGHGLPVGTGMALASRLTNQPYRVFIVMGDGECNEGSVWEAALVAAQHKLSNLIVIVDRNRQQGLGHSKNIIDLDPLNEKFASFGWQTHVVDGHDISALLAAMTTPADKPIMIIASTTKGKGVSYMEDQILWHYRNPNQEQYQQAIDEIDRM